MKTWAALDVRGTGDSELLLLALDDFEATALEDRSEGRDGVRVFFADARHRDQALAGLPAAFEARAVDVPDDDWARRSQLDLLPVTVGRITVFPTPETLLAGSLESSPADNPLRILILPSMGFGTGHHATTRLCLAALQTLDLSDRLVVDVGTGSGVLALASRLLGARDVIGIDYDADAIQSAEDSLALNRAIDRVRFELADLRNVALPAADAVIANLTGAVITRWAPVLGSMLRPGGTLVISGVQTQERDEVFAALAPAQLTWDLKKMGGLVQFSRSEHRRRPEARVLTTARHALVVTGVILGIVMSGAAQGPGRASRPPRDISTPNAQDPELPDGRVSGVVLAADTGRPVRRARVFISAPQLSEGRGVLTEDDGSFTFEELPEGRYSLTVSKSGFVSLSYGQRRPLQPGTPLQLADGQELSGLEFRLPRGSVIAGHVFDDGGDPLPGANVRLMRYQYVQGQRQLLPVEAAQTDDRGYYRIWGLNPGEYYVSAVSRSLNLNGRGGPPPGVATPPAATAGPPQAPRGRRGFFQPPAPAAPASSEQVAYAPTFYPGVPSINEATAVSVGLGAELVDVDFGLLLVRTSRVSGHVTNPDGVATTAGNINLFPDGAAGGRVGTNFGGRIEWDGSFTINNVPPGRYTLRARADDTVVPHYAAQPITVASADMPDVTIVLAPAATISGTVTFENTKSAQLPDVTQVRVSAPAIDSTNIGPNANARVDREGRFTLDGVPAGSHWVRASGPLRGWMLKSVTVEGRETIDTPLDLESGAAVSGVALTFTDKLTEVNGTVKDDRGTPFTEYTVLAFPADASMWRPQARQIMTARPDQNGRFQIRGLPPGDYLLATVDPTEQGEWFEPTFLELHRSDAARLSIGDGDTKTHDFKITR